MVLMFLDVSASLVAVCLSVLYNYTTISFNPQGVVTWPFPTPFPMTWSS